MGRIAENFNRSGLSRFLNGPSGRVVRVVTGLGFLIVGLAYRRHTLGVISMIWSVFPLSAGAFDVCYLSALFGGPFAGAKIREKQKSA